MIINRRIGYFTAEISTNGTLALESPSTQRIELPPDEALLLLEMLTGASGFLRQCEARARDDRENRG
jgi:hypothetical protein